MSDLIFRVGQGLPPQAHASAQTMGFKAWNLLRMAEMGLPVPPAVVLGTGFCAHPAQQARAAQPDTWRPSLQWLEQQTGRRLGDVRRPLLLSVRSGAPVSMPGMMETLLNIGLNDLTAPGLVRMTGNPRLVWDAYRRLVATHGEVVAGIDARVFEDELHQACQGRDERELDFNELRQLTQRYLQAYQSHAGHAFAQAAEEQLASAIDAVLQSWQAPKARAYRDLHALPDTLGTAVTLQAMVFGNAGGRSGAGVGFTRDPSTGESGLWVDFLFNAQGEDVVSGRRSAHGHESLATVLPQAWSQLCDCTARLEHTLGDMQDFEFTVQDGQLFLLQTRQGKRTPRAAMRIALDLLDEGVINRDEALARTHGLGDEAFEVQQVVAEREGALDAPGLASPLGHAASACSGVASGQLALSEAQARARHEAGAAVILVRQDAETNDLAALECAQGLLTQRGARTAHAAVVARQLGKVCLVGCEALSIDEKAGRILLGEVALQEGDTLTLDGNTGAVYAGTLQTCRTEDTQLRQRWLALQASR